MLHKGTKLLETPRLILRRFVREDGEAMYRNWCSDPEVTKFLTWSTHSNSGESTAVAESWATGYSCAGFYQWAITIKELGDEPVGSIGTVRTDESISTFAIGYCIGKEHWGKGYMSEALAAVIDYLFGEVGALRIESWHDVNNPASGAVMKKCGMTYEGTLRQADRNNQGICDIAKYSVLAAEWREKYNSELKTIEQI